MTQRAIDTFNRLSAELTKLDRIFAIRQEQWKAFCDDRMHLTSTQKKEVGRHMIAIGKKRMAVHDRLHKLKFQIIVEKQRQQEQDEKEFLAMLVEASKIFAKDHPVCVSVSPRGIVCIHRMRGDHPSAICAGLGHDHLWISGESARSVLARYHLPTSRDPDFANGFLAGQIARASGGTLGVCGTSVVFSRPN
ncbi:MAG: hypothetical protein Edafosvirus2_64 [Edafosvirus sp.]|uniref:Uncharacterized protein n=1 Tax=Edafosvirus sp. TaxID=2487765 RepID=A0A3G4ZSM3_9VIRU|nr:MAG: hypothetical protein Edafosvirus2_64 [Edafosvirus sp.]